MRYFIFLLVFCFTLPAHAVEKLEWWDLNVAMQFNKNWSVGAKEFVGWGDNHRWIRYSSSDKPFSFEYRDVQFKDGTRDENWYRLQWKHLNKEGFYYWSRLEYREIDGTKSHLRYRPRIGYKKNIGALGNTYIFIEPHWNMKDNTVPLIMTYVGTSWNVGNYNLGVFLQSQSDDKYDMQRVFLGTDITYKF